MGVCGKVHDGWRCGLKPDHDGPHIFKPPYTRKPSGAYKFTNNGDMRDYELGHHGCTCYYDTYDAHMDPKIDCPHHGEEKRKRMDGDDATYRPPPNHYSTGAGIDPWQVWDAFDLDRYTANAVKYLLRAGKKDIAPRLDDLKKARDYVNKAIEREENK